jgi:hypothetical protein
MTDEKTEEILALRAILREDEKWLDCHPVDAEEPYSVSIRRLLARLEAAPAERADGDAEDSCDLCFLHERNVEALQQRLDKLEGRARAVVEAERWMATTEAIVWMQRRQEFVEAVDALRDYFTEQEANDAT